MAYYTFGLLVLSTLLSPVHSRPLQDSQPIASCPTSDAVSFKGTTANNVESFLNIRFGEDTSGANRFTPPKEFNYPPGTLVNATTPGAACPQPKQAVSTMPLFDNVTHMSEDCLTLRVDRPAGTPASAKLPVMVWIYGGGDTFGQIYDSAYDPTGLVLGAASKGYPVIYVAMNYRVGVFGFAASPALNATDSLNAGLLDQCLAIEWVRDHIAAFGGDPENVTIFGESDGATGVGLQITAYGGKQKAPFKRAIMQSGSPMADKETAGTKSLRHTKELTKLVNCTASTSEAELQCLRSIPMAKLNSIAVTYENKVGGNSGMGVFVPVAPSTFIPDSPSKLLATGRFSRNIDTLAGWNEDDGSFSTLPTLSSDEDVFTYLKYEYPALSNKTIKQAMALYPVSSFPDLPSENISAHYFRTSRLERDAEFTCPSLYTAQMNHKYSPDTANYLFSLNQTVYRSAYAAANVSYLGVSHFSDIPYVFNQASAEALAPYATKEDLRLSNEISGSWAAFANTGRPSGGNGTITGWTDAFGSGGGAQDQFLYVIGGPDSGSRKTKYDDIGARCAFWNSQEALAGRGV